METEKGHAAGEPLAAVLVCCTAELCRHWDAGVCRAPAIRLDNTELVYPGYHLAGGRQAILADGQMCLSFVGRYGDAC